MTLTKRCCKWLAGAFVALALLSSSLIVHAQTPAKDAVLLTVTGKVEVAPAGTTDWAPGRTNQVLKVGERLRTDIDSQATVRLSDLSVLRVNELTSLEIQPPEQPG